MNLTTQSGSDPEFSMTAKQRYDRYIAAAQVKAAEHAALCYKYMVRARNLGWDVDTDHVNSFFPWYDAWAKNLITAGQLRHRLGLRRMPRADYVEWSKTMNIPKAIMLDTVRTTAHNIPRDTAFVGGYVSGSGVVPWSENEWSMFPHARQVRIYQSPDENMDPKSWSVLDVETHAVTPAEAAQDHKRHIDAGIEWTCIYATRDNASKTIAAIKALGDHYWIGHVCLWLADWNLDQEHASALIGSFYDGASVIGVQFASPSSNPHTVVPGGSLQLSTANIDISVVNANWVPNVSFAAPHAPTPTPTIEHGEVVTQDSHGNYVGHDVTSTDGTHWQ